LKARAKQTGAKERREQLVTGKTSSIVVIYKISLSYFFIILVEINMISFIIWQYPGNIPSPSKTVDYIFFKYNKFYGMKIKITIL